LYTSSTGLINTDMAKGEFRHKKEAKKPKKDKLDKNSGLGL